MAEKAKKAPPPYATYGTFSNFINKLRDTTVPSRIDPSVFGNASGSVSYSVIAALKSLKLVEEDGKPTPGFVELVKASDEARKPLLESVIRSGYPSLFADGIDLSNATAAEFDEHVRKEFDVQGSTVDKIAAFFIAAAGAAGIELSPHLKARKPVSASPSSKRSSRQRKKEAESAEAQERVAPPPPPPPITEKALEYRLVDLMSEAASDAEVLSAIVKVVTWLKTRHQHQKAEA